MTLKVIPIHILLNIFYKSHCFIVLRSLHFFFLHFHFLQILDLYYSVFIYFTLLIVDIMSLVTPVQVITNIWNDPYVSKEDGGWRCKWCNKYCKGLNVLRVVHHLARTGDAGVVPCPGDIPEAKALAYKNLVDRKLNKKIARSNALAERNMLL